MMNEKEDTSTGERAIAVKRHPLSVMAKIWWTCLRASTSSDFAANKLAAFEASLQGEIPTGQADLILVACNDAYFENYAHALVNSAASLGDRFAIHIHLLEPSKKTIEQAKLLQCRHSTVHLTFTIDHCGIADTLHYRNIYYTAARFLLVPLLLERGVRQLLVIDIDALMKNSPWPILNQAIGSSNGAFIFRSRQWKPWKKILASAVLYRPTDQSRSMARKVARSLLATMEQKPKYHIDQIIPYFLMQIGGHRLRSTFSDMPHNIMSYRYEKDAAFWTTKGPEKTSDRFLLEKSVFES